MSHVVVNRRSFLQTAAATAAGSIAQNTMAAQISPALKILEPPRGRLEPSARQADRRRPDDPRPRRGPPRRPGDRQRRGLPLRRKPFRGRRAPAPAGDGPGGRGRGESASADRVRVVWDRYSEPRYRFSHRRQQFLSPRHRPEELSLAVRLLLPENAPRSAREVRREVLGRTSTTRRPTMRISHRRRFPLPSSPTATRASGATTPIGCSWPFMPMPTCRTGRTRMRRRRSSSPTWTWWRPRSIALPAKRPVRRPR